jgi:hypothetical protein
MFLSSTPTARPGRAAPVGPSRRLPICSKPPALAGCPRPSRRERTLDSEEACAARATRLRRAPSWRASDAIVLLFALCVYFWLSPVSLEGGDQINREMPLHSAATNDHADIVCALLDAGVARSCVTDFLHSPRAVYMSSLQHAHCSANALGFLDFFSRAKRESSDSCTSVLLTVHVTCLKCGHPLSSPLRLLHFCSVCKLVPRELGYKKQIYDA